MWTFNRIFGKIFDWLFIPFQNMNPWVGMIIVSFLTGLLMLVIFRYTSNQAGIRKVKNKIKAHLLELRLYKDNLGLSMKAQGNILLANLKYITHSFKPLAVMILPVVLILIQMNFWFGYESLKPGESTLLKVKLEEGYNPLQTNLSLETDPEIFIETPPLRIEEYGEINWRISSRESGVHNVHVIIAGNKISKTISTSTKPLSKLSPSKRRQKLVDELFYPVESPISKDLPVKSIEVLYSSKSMTIFGLNIHWLIAYFVLSIIFGFSFKGVFKVEI
jgi:uncharacterized membrane protein (DUF106 family)